MRFLREPILLLTIRNFSPSQADYDVWGNHGGGILNNRYRDDRSIKARDLSTKIQVKWIFETDETSTIPSISATPAIGDNRIYFPSWDGRIYAVDKDDGSLVWSRVVSDITSKVGDTSRATPVLADVYHEGETMRILMDGSLAVESPSSPPLGSTGAKIYALDRDMGNTIWITTLDHHPAAKITQSGTYYDGYFYVGVSSQEEAFAGIPGYDCCSFVGSLHKVNAATGEIVWSADTIQGLATGPGSYSGNAVWGSSPSIDTKRNQVYIGTGNNYQAPENIQACFNDAVAARQSSAHCVEDGNFVDAIVALDMDDGSVVWHTEVQGYDAWNLACVFGLPNCPQLPGPDWDFGAAPMLIIGSNSGRSERSKAGNSGSKRPKRSRGGGSRLKGSKGSSKEPKPKGGKGIKAPKSKSKAQGQNEDRLIVGQKSGLVYSLNPDDGKILFAAAAGPGGNFGGHSWGASTDGTSSYFGQINFNYQDFEMVSGDIINRGAWIALNNTDGKVIWSTPVDQTFFQPFCNPFSSPCYDFAAGPTTVVNNVLFVGATNADGTVYALNTENGDILWRYDTGGSIYGGFSADGDGCVYVGSGYRQRPTGFYTTNNQLYAFCVEEDD